MGFWRLNFSWIFSFWILEQVLTVEVPGQFSDAEILEQFFFILDSNCTIM